MKRIIVLSLLILVLIMHAGCSSNTNSESKDNPQKSSNAIEPSTELIEPTEPPQDEIIDMVTTSTTAAVIKTDNNLWMWGKNDCGQIGNGTKIDVSKPTKILDDVIYVALDRYYSAAIKSDNTLWLWGSNQYGQLGELYIGNDSKNKNTPLQTVPTKIMEDVAKVSLGENVAGVIKLDGSLWLWGQNYLGQIGNGSSSGYESFTKIMDDVDDVVFGDSNVVALKKDGSLWTWGLNVSGVLGNGENGLIGSSDCYEPTPTKILDNVAYTRCAGFWGFQNTLAVTNDNSLWMWGGNQYGQIGSSDSDGLDAWDRPARVTPLEIISNVLSVSISRAGDYNNTVTACVTNDKELFAWGSNLYEQVGNGSSEDVNTPTKIMDNASQVVVNGSVAAAIQEDGSLWAWGKLKNGLTAKPQMITENSKRVFIAFDNDIFVLKNDGILWNASGDQLIRTFGSEDISSKSPDISTNNTLNFDGIYCYIYDKDGEKNNSVFRFFEDGTINYVTVTSTKLDKTPFPKNSWFNSSSDSVSLGSYSIENLNISVQLFGKETITDYWGTVSRDGMTLSLCNSYNNEIRNYVFYSFNDIPEWDE